MHSYNGAVHREDQILDAAEKLFSERSFDGVGVDAIGKGAGVSGSAIYRHFSSKDEILAALFDRVIDKLLLRVGEPADDPHEELARLIDAHIDFAVDHPRLADIWIREQRALTRPHMRKHLRRERIYTDLWLNALRNRYPDRPASDLRATMRAVHSLITSDATRPSSSTRPVQLKILLRILAYSALQGLDVSREHSA